MTTIRRITGLRCYILSLTICFYSFIPVTHCIVTPVNATLPLSSQSNSKSVTSSSSSSAASSSSLTNPSLASTSSSTTTVTPIDTSASAAGIASPVYSDTLGRMMAASSFIQNNIQNKSSQLLSTSSSSVSSSSTTDSNATDQPFRPSSGPSMLPETLTPNALSSMSKSFVDIVKDYERYKLAKYSGPRSVPPPSLIYQGDVRSVNNREPLLSPSTLQGYNNNNNNNDNNQHVTASKILAGLNGLNSDAYEYSFLGNNGPPTRLRPHPTSGSSSTSGAEDYLSWSDDDVPFGMVKGYGESAVSGDSYFPSSLDYSSNYGFELLPQGSKTTSHEPVASSQGSYSSTRPSGPNNNQQAAINSELLGDSSGFFNYHSLVSNMDSNDDLPILIESYVVNYPPLSEKPVAHSLSAFTFDHRPSTHHSNHHDSSNHHHHHHSKHSPIELTSHSSTNHHHHRMPLLTSASMTYPMIGPKPTSERVFISPYLYSRPCKYDCFANPLQDMKYGLMNFLEGAHNHGRR